MVDCAAVQSSVAALEGMYGIRSATARKTLEMSLQNREVAAVHAATHTETHHKPLPVVAKQTQQTLSMLSLFATLLPTANMQAHHAPRHNAVPCR